VVFGRRADFVIGSGVTADRDGLAILDPDELGRTTVLAEATL